MITLRPAAALDIEEIREWYEDKQAGLGDQFLDDLNRTLEMIQSFPLMYAVIGLDARCAVLKRFPYQVYYQVIGDKERVFGVFHSKRHPKNWRKRL